MSVSELKAEIQRLGAAGKMFSGMEKGDLVKLVAEARTSSAASAASAGVSLNALCDSVYPNAAARRARLRYEDCDVKFAGNTRNPTAIISLCHGLGDTNDGWAQAAEYELLPNLAARDQILFVLPTAPKQPITMNMRAVMTGWYDIVGLGERSSEDPEGVALSTGYLHSLISRLQQQHNVPSSRVVLAGFSQGAALSLSTGLLFGPEPPAAIVAMSGYFAAREFVLPRIKNTGTPIFMAHGTQDPMVRLEVAQMSKKLLEDEGKVTSITLKTYPMGHSTHPREMADVVSFMNSVLPKL
jgi:predicted esterase